MITKSEFLEWMAEPLGMHPDSAAGRSTLSLLLETPTETLIMRWCCRNKCGGVYAVTKNRWTLITPITFEDFLEELNSNGILPMEARDWQARRWIKACRMASDEADGRH